MSWHTGPVVAFDLETTGVDVESDRIVTATVAVVHGPGGVPELVREWLADPGIEIPAAASAVHGISTERARAEGVPAKVAVDEIVRALRELVGGGLPVVAMNARYDLTLLDREARRHGIAPLDVDALRVIDPLVIDKAQDRYRRGKRTLERLCEFYGVRLVGAHNSTADAVAGAHVVRAQCEWYGLNALSLEELHRAQIGWAAEQAASLQEYFRRQGRHEAVVEGAWPVIPAQRAGGDA